MPKLHSYGPSLIVLATALGDGIVAAAQRWIEMVRASELGEHPYTMNEGELDKFVQQRP